MARLKDREMRAEAEKLAKAMGVEADEILELAEAGFSESDDSEYFRMIVATSAPEKTGKTHWALHTTPSPVALIDFDIGTEGVINKRDPKRRILHRQFNLKAQSAIEGRVPRREEWEKEWSDCETAVRACVANSLIRTLVIDTGTEMWELARLAEFGKVDQVKPHHYGPLNREYRMLVQSAYSRKDLNVVITHKVKKQYKNDNWNGEYERAGFGDVAFLVQVNVDHYVEVIEEGEDGAPDQTEFGIRVLNCRQNPEVNGLELEGPLCSFAVLGRKVFPNSKREDWT